MTGKEKCELLRNIRKQIAEANGIVYLDYDCNFEGDCRGTCPKCDAQLRYLDAELNRKRERGEEVTVSGISVDAFEEILKSSTPSEEMDPANPEENEAPLDVRLGEYDSFDDQKDDHDEFRDYRMGAMRPPR